MQNYKFIRTTIGLQATHENYSKPALVRVEYYENSENTDEIKMVAVNGKTLSKLKKCSSIVITREDYQDIPEDAYDDAVEAISALEMLGWAV